MAHTQDSLGDSKAVPVVRIPFTKRSNKHTTEVTGP